MRVGGGWDQKDQHRCRNRTTHQRGESGDERSGFGVEISKRIWSRKTGYTRERVDYSHRNRRLGTAEDFRWNRPEHGQKCDEHTDHVEHGDRYYRRIRHADQTQESGCGDEQWKRSMPASFALFVGMPSV